MRLIHDHDGIQLVNHLEQCSLIRVLDWLLRGTKRGRERGEIPIGLVCLAPVLCS